MLATRSIKTVGRRCCGAGTHCDAACLPDVRRFIGARNDTASSVDIRSVVVDNSTAARNKVTVVVRQDDVRAGDSIHSFVNARRRDPGPEYILDGVTAVSTPCRK